MKKTPWKIGLLQAAGVVFYIMLIVGLLTSMNHFVSVPNEFLAGTIMLSLLVFSAAATGSMVFGYPAFLAANQKVKEAFSVFAYTLVFLLAAMGIILVIAAKLA
ncbi:hypothetical protein KJ611_03875 [Patescibacteria group bacterium]|nr:hypothetical protein [Patescibacteria group bacterium]MBU1705826.1 hypothetical protein [Patescibacteria group bacterium]